MVPAGRSVTASTVAVARIKGREIGVGKPKGLAHQPDLRHDPRYQALTHMDGRRARRAREREAVRKARKESRTQE